jgi:hypothetical protein
MPRNNISGGDRVPVSSLTRILLSLLLYKTYYGYFRVQSLLPKATGENVRPKYNGVFNYTGGIVLVHRSNQVIALLHSVLAFTSSRPHYNPSSAAGIAEA